MPAANSRRARREDGRNCRPSLEGIRLGTLLGLAMGIIVSVWVTLVRVVFGSGAFSDLRTSYGAVVATYLVCGAGAGALCGLLGACVRGPRGAALLGFVVALPCGVAIRVSQDGLSGWTPDDATTIVGWSAILGSIVGYRLWGVLTRD